MQNWIIYKAIIFLPNNNIRIVKKCYKIYKIINIIYINENNYIKFIIFLLIYNKVLKVKFFWVLVLDEVIIEQFEKKWK